MKTCCKFKAIKADQRLSFLRSQLKKEGRLPPMSTQFQRRQSFDQHKYSSLPLAASQPCFCCVVNKATLRHHVIPLANGGRNKRNNIVPLCNSCHAKVHEFYKWAPKPKPKFVSPLSSFSGLVFVPREQSRAAGDEVVLRLEV